MRIAYFDCFSGIAGDMALGALLDAGADRAALEEGLGSLNLPGWSLQVRKATQHGLAATDVEVVVGETPARDEPTIEPPAGHTDHGHSHGHAHEHHGSRRRHRRDDHSHTRGLAEIRALIAESALPAAVKERGDRVFTRLAEAEARVHNLPVDEVHFHEVGAVDSIVDVLGSVYALHLLGVEEVVSSPLPCGHGFIQAAHGRLPVPAPATAELLKGVPVRSVDVEGELVTPTGAALISTLAARFGPLPSMTPVAVGYGSGKKRFPFPNLLRVIVGEGEVAPEQATEVALLEANLDDLSPQLYEHVMDRLFAAGALDVYLQPVLMKKGRPAQVLSVLCEPARAGGLAAVVFTETSTLGLRESRLQRRVLRREHRPVETPYGTVRVKIGWFEGKPVTVAPEYEDCRSLARERGVPLKEVQAAAAAVGRQVLELD